MARLGRTCAGICDRFAGSVLVYTKDGVVLVKGKEIDELRKTKRSFVVNC
jgi:hypothetical protein